MTHSHADLPVDAHDGLLIHLPTPVLLVRLPEGLLLQANPAAYEQLQLPAGGQPLDSLFLQNTDWRELQLRLKQGPVRQFEARLQGAHGRPVWMLLSAREQWQGEQRYLWLSLHDVSERRKREFQLQANEALHQQILTTCGEGYLQFDAATNRIVDANPAFCQLLGCSTEQVLGATLADFLAPDCPPTPLTDRHWPEQQETVRGELSMLRADRIPLTVQVQANVLRDERGQEVTRFALLTDMTERKKNEERMIYLAFYDPLTALPNRLLFHERLQQALFLLNRQGQPFALLFLDLDHFKQVNDTLGHDVGDELLREIGRRLFQAVRESDTVARLGGDEFVVLLQGVRSELAAATGAEKLLSALADPIQIGEHSLQASVSIGIARAPEDGNDASTIRKKADLAMYAAKAAGKHTYRFASE